MPRTGVPIPPRALPHRPRSLGRSRPSPPRQAPQSKHGKTKAGRPTKRKVETQHVDAGSGVFSSLGLFQNAEQGKDSSNLVATWIRDEKLETMIPNAPKITTGEVVAHANGVTV